MGERNYDSEGEPEMDLSGYTAKFRQDDLMRLWTWEAWSPGGNCVYGPVLTSYYSRAEAERDALEAIERHAKRDADETVSGNELERLVRSRERAAMA